MKKIKLYRIMLKADHPQYKFDSLSFLVQGAKSKDEAEKVAKRQLREAINREINPSNNLKIKTTKKQSIPVHHVVSKEE